MAAKKKKKVARGKRRRGKARSFANDIASVLDSVEAEYMGETQNAAYYSAVTVVAGAFVWAMHRGCPPPRLTAVMSEALSFALRSEGLHPEIMVEIDQGQRDPKEVN